MTAIGFFMSFVKMAVRDMIDISLGHFIWMNIQEFALIRNECVF